jgi:hypothetical protein
MKKEYILGAFKMTLDGSSNKQLHNDIRLCLRSLENEPREDKADKNALIYLARFFRKQGQNNHAKVEGTANNKVKILLDI